MHAYEWLREQQIPEESWKTALSRTQFDTSAETLFRKYFNEAALRVRNPHSKPRASRLCLSLRIPAPRSGSSKEMSAIQIY